MQSTQKSFTRAIAIEASRQTTRIAIVMTQMRGIFRGYPRSAACAWAGS